MLPRASRHSSEPKWSIPRLRRLWLPLALAALALATVVMLAAGGSGAAGALLSQGRPASANSSYVGCRPAAANDGSLSTRWMAGSGAYPQRWTVDLGAAKRLGLVTVTWQRANNRVYGYRIVGSNDRSTWTVLKDRRANATIGTTADAVSGAYRYVRVTVLGSTYGWAQIYEVRVYAAGTAAPPATPTPRPAAAPPATPTPTPTMTFSTPTPTATVVFSPTPTPAPTPTATTIGGPASGGSVTAANTSATAVDAAISAAKAKGPGTTVFFPRGDYSHATLTWPDGINLRGAGIGATRLDFALKFGSNSFIENATMGGTQSTSFSFANGAHDSVFEDVRFRGRGFSLWQATDFTSEFNGGVVNRSGNFHDVAFRRAEFEYTGVADGDLWSIWWDARAGGGSIYDVTWEDCVFGAKNSTGAFGQGRMGILIQPSPPEHASDGPRPGAAITGSTDYNFDWSQVTHGSGTAIPAADYGFRITGCYFVGPASLSSFDLCDYIRAWAMTTYHIPTSSPGNVTQAMRDAAPDRMATKGVYVENTFFSGKWTKEFGRDVSDINNTKSGGTGSYNVPAIVKTHDAELYGS